MIESPTDRAAQSVTNAVEDFQTAIEAATTTGEALAVHRVVLVLVETLRAVEDAAIQKADRLN